MTLLANREIIRSLIDLFLVSARKKSTKSYPHFESKPVNKWTNQQKTSKNKILLI